MKKQLIAIAALLLSFCANAQKATYLVDLNGYYDHQKARNTSLNNWQYNVSVGRQVAKHFAAGIFWQRTEQHYTVPDSVVYNTSGGPQKFADNVIYRRSYFCAGLWGRYIYQINKRFFFYTHIQGGVLYSDRLEKLPGSVGYSTPFTTNGVPDPQLSYYGGHFIHITPAIGMTIYKGFGAHASAGSINYDHSNVNGFYKYDRISVNFTKNATIGVQKIINTKKSRELAEAK